MKVDIYTKFAVLQEVLRSRHQALDRVDPDDGPGYETAVQLVLDATSEMLDFEDQMPALERQNIERYINAVLIVFTVGIAMLTILASSGWRWLFIPILLASLILIAARKLGGVTALESYYNVGVVALAVTLVLAVISVIGLLPTTGGVILIISSAVVGFEALGFIDVERKVRKAWNVDR